MALGRKTGGRTRGTPNKRTLQAADILEELGCDPIRGMAEIATNESHHVELRARMFMELAQYVYPKRKAVYAQTGPEPPAEVSSDDLIRYVDKRAERLAGRPDGPPDTKVVSRPTPFAVESPGKTRVMELLEQEKSSRTETCSENASRRNHVQPSEQNTLVRDGMDG